MRKGTVTAYDESLRKYKITFPDHGNVVTPWITAASHVSGLEIGTMVVVAIFSDGMDGAVIMGCIEE